MRGDLKRVIAGTALCAKLLPDNLFTFRYLQYNVFCSLRSNLQDRLLFVLDSIGNLQDNFKW